MKEYAKEIDLLQLRSFILVLFLWTGTIRKVRLIKKIIIKQ